MPPSFAAHRPSARLVLLFGVLIAVLWPPTAASACSCGPASLDELVERDPEVAVGLVRRTDPGGPARGTGAVLHRVRGDLPDEVDLRLDDGGSCEPAVGPGELAVLAFRPAGSGWETLACGEVPLEVAIADRAGPLTVDPDATGPPAVALSGGLPGVDVAVLDDHLRALAVADVAARPGALHRCGEDLVVETFDEQTGDVGLVRLDGTSLTVTEELAVADGAVAPRLIDVACDDGSVSALVQQDGTNGAPAIVLRRSTDDDDGTVEIAADADHAAFAGEHIVVLRGARDDRLAAVTAIEASGGDDVWTVELGAIGADAVHVSPDDRAVALGPYRDGEPRTLVLDAATGDELGHGAVGRIPRWEGPWAGSDRLVLADDGGSGYLEAARPLEDGIVDARVRPVRDLPALTPRSLTASEHGLLAVGGAELTIVPLEGEVLVSDDLALTGAEHGLLLAPVVTAATPPDERDLAPLEVDVATEAVTVPSGGGAGAPTLAVGGIAGAGIVLAAGAVVIRRRRTGRSAPT